MLRRMMFTTMLAFVLGACGDDDDDGADGGLTTDASVTVPDAGDPDAGAVDGGTDDAAPGDGG
jgi:hypothetical protein